MFRRKDNEPAPSTDSADNAFAKPQAEARPQAELPRRPEVTPPANNKPPATVMDAGGKRLMVGQGISLAGEITACDRLVVEGSVQVTLNQTKAIEIAETGRFTDGKAEVDEAEISGTYEGELTVRKRLFIKSTGRVKGTVRYGELEIEKGGRLQGSVSMLDEKAGN